jgi:serine/threonine-protein kinase
MVLADFGAAELVNQRDGAGRVAAGTPLYLAPEQIEGAPASPATDLYAAGAILWEATFGQPLRSHAGLMRGTPETAPADAHARLTAARSREWADVVLALLELRRIDL